MLFLPLVIVSLLVCSVEVLADSDGPNGATLLDRPPEPMTERFRDAMLGDAHNSQADIRI